MKILAIRFSGLGDIVMLLQTLTKLKEKYEGAHITLLCDEVNQDIALNSGGVIDRAVGINRQVFKKRQVFSIVQQIVKLLSLKKETYDLIIDFQNFGETAFITHYCTAKEKRGAPKKSSRTYAYTTVVPRDDERNHRSQFFSRIAGVDDSLDYSKMVLSKTAEKYAQLIKSYQDNQKKSVGLNIGSSQESRRWSEKKFAALAQRLNEHYNVLVFAGPSEKQYLSAFSKSIITVTDISLDALCGAISTCDYFISNDTGPVHIAAALKIPTMTFFSTGTDENVGALISNKVSLVNVDDINAIELEDALSLFETLTSTKK